MGFELSERDFDLNQLTSEVKMLQKQLDKSTELLNNYEGDMKLLWKQRDELVNENSGRYTLFTMITYL